MVRLEISDDGMGFDPRQRPGTGLGMVGMRARARSAGGELVVESAPGKGVRIAASLPYKERPEGQ